MTSVEQLAKSQFGLFFKIKSAISQHQQYLGCGLVERTGEDILSGRNNMVVKKQKMAVVGDTASTPDSFICG